MKNKIELQINGVSREVIAEIIDKKIWFKLDDTIFSYSLLDLGEGQFKKSKAANRSTDRLVSNMPGKVTKVFVVEGQVVNKGDALLVMEAMKMEYTFKADIEAEVVKIFVKVADQVPLGHLLIQLQEIKKV